VGAPTILIKGSALSDIAIILLAAGHSRRFGTDNKLLAGFDGKPLISHMATPLLALPTSKRIAAIGRDIDPDLLPGFETVVPNATDALQSDSLKAALAVALEKQPDGVLLCLADMPLIPQSHYEQLLAYWNGPATLAATRLKQRLMPPALFGKNWFSALMQLEGDQGARALLVEAQNSIPLAEALAVDIDTVTDLQRLRLFQV
jgi:molybdenum cofactor cytidylyltransferase